MPAKRWYERLTQRMMNNFASLQAAPVAACLLLLVGAGAGTLGSYWVAQNRAAHAAAVRPVSVAAEADSAPAEIASISSIVRQPNSEMVEGELQPGGSAADAGVAGRSEDSRAADDGVGELDLTCGAGRLGGPAGGGVPRGAWLPGGGASATR